jgi:ABC-2 type transport system ATP-binding protein
MLPAIEFRNVVRKFGTLTAVDHLSLVIPQGEVFGLVGPDGAGKTTSLRMICGLMDPTEGEVLIEGTPVRQNLNAVKDKIGYMAQRFGLYQDLTVDENLDFYADLFGVMGNDREALTKELLDMTRMAPFRDRPAGKLSGGMKQKLALMCTLLHHPKILFLDEPTNGVDPVSRRDFWEILHRLVHDGLTLMVSTAYLDEAERCNRVGLLYKGRMIHCDRPDKLKSLFHADTLEDAFIAAIQKEAA